MPRQRTTARYETKPGGYERWRSWEWRPHTSRQSKEGVYVYVHRLLAVAMAPQQKPISDVLTALDGKDVHHINGVNGITARTI